MWEPPCLGGQRRSEKRSSSALREVLLRLFPDYSPSLKRSDASVSQRVRSHGTLTFSSSVVISSSPACWKPGEAQAVGLEPNEFVDGGILGITGLSQLRHPNSDRHVRATRRHLGLRP